MQYLSRAALALALLAPPPPVLASQIREISGKSLFSGRNIQHSLPDAGMPLRARRSPLSNPSRLTIPINDADAVSLRTNPRPVANYSFYTLGLDIGGGSAKLMAVPTTINNRRTNFRKDKIPTEGKAPEWVMAQVVARVQEWGLLLNAVGIGMPGLVDRDGVVEFSPNLPQWIGFSLKQSLQALGTPVVHNNDANVAVYGAYVGFLKEKPRNVIGATLGTGVGGGIILDGKLYRGSTHSAAEIGHVPVDTSLSARKCGCGQYGCLEAYVGRKRIVETAEELLSTRPRQGKILRAYREQGGLDPKVIEDAAKAGDPIALRTYQETARKLSVALRSVVTMYNPDAILLLGEVARARDLLTDLIVEDFKANPLKTPFSHVRLHVALGDWGAMGAAMLARDSLRKPQ